MNLYQLQGAVLELNDRYEILMETIEAANGEITPELEEAMESLDEERRSLMEEIAKKPEQYLRWYRNVKTDAEVLKAEKQKLEKKQKAAEKKCEYIKDLVLDACNLAGVTTIKGDTMKAFTREIKTIEVDNTTAIAPYKQSIIDLAKNLPPWLSIETKILKSAVEPENLPEGFSRKISQSITIK